MLKMKALKGALIEKTEGGYRITFELEGAENTEVFATISQISSLIDDLEIAIDDEMAGPTEEDDN